MLAERKADAQRSVNLYLMPVESGSGKAPVILKSVPGLVEFSDLGAEVRGLFTTTGGRCFAVGGYQVFELLSDGTATALGSLGSSAGRVGMAQNSTYVFIVDGADGYTIALPSGVVALIPDADFYGSNTVSVIDEYGLFIRPGTGQFYISSPGGVDFDALDFATAEGAPDNLVAVIADHREAWLFGTHSTEVWFNSGDADFPFSRNNSAFLEVGTPAPHSVQRIGDYVMWLGQSAEGSGMVYINQGYQARRVSTAAVETAFDGKSLESAEAWTYQDRGHWFYCLKVAGVDTTWCFDVTTNAWHERAELLDGAYTQSRVRCHAFAFGKHLVGSDDGRVYWLSETANTNDGDPLVRDRVSPHYATPMLERVFHGTFEIDASAGDAPDGVVPLVSMRYSNDGGRTWNAWRTRELGRTGEFAKRVRWGANGAAFDRVWQVRCTDNAPFSIISARAGT